jgi:hypothetical protein
MSAVRTMSETPLLTSGLSTSELEVLAALDEHFMCASVIKIRAGYSSSVLVEGTWSDAGRRGTPRSWSTTTA